MSKKFRTFLLSLTNCPNTPHKNLHIFKYAYIYVVYKQSMYIFVLCVSLVNCLNPKKKCQRFFWILFGFLLFRMCSCSVAIKFPMCSPSSKQNHIFIPYALPKVVLFSPTYIHGAEGECTLSGEQKLLFWEDSKVWIIFLPLFCGDKPITMAHCPPLPKRKKLKWGGTLSN